MSEKRLPIKITVPTSKVIMFLAFAGTASIAASTLPWIGDDRIPYATKAFGVGMTTLLALLSLSFLAFDCVEDVKQYIKSLHDQAK